MHSNRDQYYLDELEEKIIERVSEGVKSIPRPFGLLLSGGFDSSFLAALTKPDFVYRMRFPYGPRYDESIYSDAVIKHLGIKDVRDVFVTKEEFEDNFEDAVKTFGKPTTHFSLVPLNILMLTITEDCESPRILSGEGPDEYLGGYARQIIFDELQKISGLPELRNYKGLVDRVVGTDFVYQYGLMMNYPPDKVADYQKYYDMGIYPLQGAIGKMDMDLGHIEEMEQTLAKSCDVELLYPYIDKDFAEYCYKLPDDLKIRSGVTKWAFKEIAMKYLPEIMRNRLKMGGPVAPVNEFLGCVHLDGHFGKGTYLLHQEAVLSGEE